jgi:hypothetical protein
LGHFLPQLMAKLYLGTQEHVLLNDSKSSQIDRIPIRLPTEFDGYNELTLSGLEKIGGSQRGHRLNYLINF